MEEFPPSPRPLGVSDEEAVELCRAWMIYLGARDTVVATGLARELCDVYSTGFLGWVDNRIGNLDVEAVEKAATLSAADGRQPLIFVRGGMRPVARERADALYVPIFRYQPEDGAIDGVNAPGRRLHNAGLRPQ